MTSSTAPAVQPAAKSLAARLLGVLFAPRSTYADVAAHPRWFGVLAVIVLTGSVATFGFLSTEVGKQAMLEQQVRMMESFGMKIPDEAYARIEQSMDHAPRNGAIGHAVSMTLAALVVSGIALAVFNGIGGGDARFKQVFSIAAHSGLIVTLSQLFGLPLSYARQSMSGATNLAVFAPFLDEQTFAARLLGSIDLFMIWWAV